ncbi:MAG: class I SAM-dependent methyltransferase [Alphaproteobacteria bacterium]|nr:class I SAM-dependent methyltransferase [Alphaproteobacteria bacterium]
MNLKNFFLYILFFISYISAEELKPYDWSQVLEIPPGTDRYQGAQVLHFKSADKHYGKSLEALKFVDENLLHAKRFQSDAEVIKFASESVTLSDGMFIETGTCTGKTINFIAGLNPHRLVYGFDSFEGLPEAWIRKDMVFQKGTFAFKKDAPFPAVLQNVRLYKGWFKDALPVFKAKILKKTPIAFLHVDCAIYSSTRDVLTILGDNIVDGTIIVFDELYNYPGYENHEWKALQEFLKEKHYRVEFLAFNENHEQVAVKIIADT